MAGPVYSEEKKSLLLEIDCEKLGKVLIKRVKCPSVTCLFLPYSSTSHERLPPVRSESGPSWQVAAGYLDINTANTVQCSVLSGTLGIKMKTVYSILPSNEYMGCACRGLHPTYSTCKHSDINVCIQSLEYHKTLLLKYM